MAVGWRWPDISRPRSSVHMWHWRPSVQEWED